MSSLPVAQLCGLSPRLSAKYGAGRAAAISSAFHAQCGNAPGWETLHALLLPKEQEEIGEWCEPSDMVIAEGVVLDYPSAEKELAVALDHFGQPCSPDDEDAATVGHLDFAWVRLVETSPRRLCAGCNYTPCSCAGDPSQDSCAACGGSGMIFPDGVLCHGHAQVAKVAYVADIKKQIWTSSGPDSLQILAYGVAYALLRECDAFVTGIWIPTDGGEWLWSEEMIYVDSPQFSAIVSRILHAAANESDQASTGQHCRDCWARLHCNEYALPAVTVDSWLGPAAHEQIDTSPDKVLALTLKLLAAEDLIDAAKKNLQERIRRGLLVVRDDATGKRWAPVAMPGKEKLLKEKLKDELGDRYQQFVIRGAGYDQFRWLKEKA